MPDHSIILNNVINKFPEKAKTLTSLFYKDEHFREICEDYYLCTLAINKIIITSEKKKIIMKEYKSVLKDLELELLVFLDS